jgi:hypothetical protein
MARRADSSVLIASAARAGSAYFTAYLASELFTHDVVDGLSPLLAAEPEVRIYDTV